MVETPQPDDIDSTFQQIDSTEWQGTLVWRGTDLSITREYHNDENVTLLVFVKYEKRGELVSEKKWEYGIEWSEGHEEYLMEGSLETVAEFAKKNHFSDPQMEFELLQEQLEQNEE